MESNAWQVPPSVADTAAAAAEWAMKKKDELENYKSGGKEWPERTSWKAWQAAAKAEADEKIDGLDLLVQAVEMHAKVAANEKKIKAEAKGNASKGGKRDRGAKA